MIVLGVDQSLTGTGWSVRTSEQEHTFGLIKTTPKDWEGDDTGRKLWIAFQVRKLVREHRPALIVMEEYARAVRNSSSLIPLVELGAYIKKVARDEDIPLLIVGSGQRCKFATGKGNSPKDVVIKEVYKRWQFDTSDNNLADAFVFGLVGWYYEEATRQKNPVAFIKDHKSLIAPQKEVLLALLKEG